MPSPRPPGARPSHRHRRRWSLPLGRVAGITVSVHLTFLLLVGLVVAAEAPDGGAAVATGLVWLVLLFACVLVHELAHSVVARRLGAVVRAIVLLPIGGVSEIERLPEGWAGELLVAVVGPLASLGLAVLAGVAALAAGLPLLPVELTSGSLLTRLAWTNLLLAGFNLLPAFPLDGGRVLRAALERRADPVRATHLAALVGRVFGVAMVVFGLFWDLWLVLIGVFVYVAAGQEERLTQVLAQLRGVRADALMRTPVYPIDARQPLQAFANGGPGSPWPQVVTLTGRYYGLADTAELQRGGPGVVADLTDRDAPALAPEEDLGRSGLERLLRSRYPALAVVDETGRVVGVLVTGDVEAWLRRHAAARP